MYRSTLCLLLFVTPLALADLKLESLGDTTINSTREETVASLKQNGWPVRPGGDASSPVLAKKLESGDYYEVVVNFANTQDGYKSNVITYKQEYRTKTVDAASMKAALLEKYGEPYELHEGSPRSSMYFSDYDGDVLGEKEVRELCSNEIVSSGRQPVAALALGESSGAVGLVAWRNYGYSKAMESCPNTVDSYKSFIAAQLAPKLEVSVKSGPNGEVVRTLRWDEPSEMLMHDRNLAAQENLDNQPKATLD